MIGHGGYFSYLLATAVQAEYYTTTAENETISFKDGTAERAANALIVENCGETVLYIQPLPGSCVYPIYKGEPYAINGVTLKGIKVFGLAGQKLRWSGCWN
ncbi:MAG: hypothetical protein ACYCWE_20750 [Eubacteriales bacterium]